MLFEFDPGGKPSTGRLSHTGTDLVEETGEGDHTHAKELSWRGEASVQVRNHHQKRVHQNKKESLIPSEAQLEARKEANIYPDLPLTLNLDSIPALGN